MQSDLAGQNLSARDVIKRDGRVKIHARPCCIATGRFVSARHHHNTPDAICGTNIGVLLSPRPHDQPGDNPQRRP